MLRGRSHYEAIYIVGPSSSGKTTLCDALRQRLPIAASIKEVARTVMKSTGFSRVDVGSGGKVEMQQAIMAAQLDEQKRALETAHVVSRGIWMPGWKHPYILSDRSAIDPVVYAGWCSLEKKNEVKQQMIGREEFQATLPHYRRSLFVVLEPIKEWIRDDGVRSLEDTSLFHQELVDMLNELGIGFRRMGKDALELEDRVRLVQEWLEEGTESRKEGLKWVKHRLGFS